MVLLWQYVTGYTGFPSANLCFAQMPGVLSFMLSRTWPRQLLLWHDALFLTVFHWLEYYVSDTIVQNPPSLQNALQFENETYKKLSTSNFLFIRIFLKLKVNLECWCDYLNIRRNKDEDAWIHVQYLCMFLGWIKQEVIRLWVIFSLSLSNLFFSFLPQMNEWR